MRGPPGEQTSGSLLYCEHYITAFVHLRNSFLQTLIQNIYYERKHETYIYGQNIWNVGNDDHCRH